MQTTGYPAERVDKWLNLPYHELDQLPIREQRKIVSIKASHLFNQQAALRAKNAMPLTYPISN
jgi:hypothetical protein